MKKNAVTRKKSDFVKIQYNNVVEVPGLWFNEYRYSDVLHQGILDDILDKMLLEMPDDRILIVSPETHKATGIGKYQYRKLKVKVDPNCPNPTIYLRK